MNRLDSCSNRGPTLLLVAIALATCGCGGCRGAPEPAASDSDAAIVSAGRDAAAFDQAAWLARHPRDDAGNLVPKSTPPPVASSEILPVPKREPDWDLAPEDPARDYVRVYVIATKRYGDSLGCVTLGASKPAPAGRRVEVTTAPACADGGAVHDVFLADVAADHLALAESAGGLALARWPDGSDPAGPPAKPIRQLTTMNQWKSPLHDAITKKQLVAIRLQTYGRGTYPVITLAGWHGAVNPAATPEDLKPLARELCQANADLPIAFFGGLDRLTALLIRCPAAAASIRWDKL